MLADEITVNGKESIVKEKDTVALEWMVYLEAQIAQRLKFSCSWQIAAFFVLSGAHLCSS